MARSDFLRPFRMDPGSLFLIVKLLRFVDNQLILHVPPVPHAPQVICHIVQRDAPVDGVDTEAAEPSSPREVLQEIKLPP